MRFAALFLAVLLLSEPLPAAPADIVVTNADVRTMDAGKPRAEAIAISGNKFIAVGTGKEIARSIGPATLKIDAGGRLVLPGFNDAHVHFAAIGNIFSTIDLKKPGTRDELKALIASYPAVLPKGRWILGNGWSPETRQTIGLSRKVIDPLTPENPVFFFSADGKAAFANGSALTMAGIDKRRSDPAAGRIEREANGEPTGFLFGKAVDLVRAFVPVDHTRNWPEILETASNYAASLGVTSVQDTHSDELGDVYRALSRQGRLKTRVYDCVALSSWAKLAAAGIRAASGDEMVRTGCVKTHVPFSGEERGALENQILAADNAGLQVLIHAIGPEANAEALDVLARVAAVNGNVGRRHRIEHAARVAANDIVRFRELNVIASMQPELFFSRGVHKSGLSAYERTRARWAFGSDAPMTVFDPLDGLRAAVTGGGGISFDTAMLAYTTGSAYAEFQESVKGRIKAGYLADLVILTNNTSAASPQDMSSWTVFKTFVNGKVVYEAK